MKWRQKGHEEKQDKPLLSVPCALYPQEEAQKARKKEGHAHPQSEEVMGERAVYPQSEELVGERAMYPTK